MAPNDATALAAVPQPTIADDAEARELNGGVTEEKIHGGLNVTYITALDCVAALQLLYPQDYENDTIVATADSDVRIVDVKGKTLLEVKSSSPSLAMHDDADPSDDRIRAFKLRLEELHTGIPQNRHGRREVKHVIEPECWEGPHEREYVHAHANYRTLRDLGCVINRVAKSRGGDLLERIGQRQREVHPGIEYVARTQDCVYRT